MLIIFVICLFIHKHTDGSNQLSHRIICPNAPAPIIIDKNPDMRSAARPQSRRCSVLSKPHPSLLPHSIRPMQMLPLHNMYLHCMHQTMPETRGHMIQRSRCFHRKSCPCILYLRCRSPRGKDAEALHFRLHRALHIECHIHTDNSSRFHNQSQFLRMLSGSQTGDHAGLDS